MGLGDSFEEFGTLRLADIKELLRTILATCLDLIGEEVGVETQPLFVPLLQATRVLRVLHGVVDHESGPILGELSAKWHRHVGEECLLPWRCGLGSKHYRLRNGLRLACDLRRDFGSEFLLE